MTKETKVGLLVGLAFIILFAIILSEKGATNNVTRPSNLTIADASQPGNSIIPRNATPLAGDGKMPIESTLPPATIANRTVRTGNPVIPERPVGVPIPKSQDDVAPLPASVVEQLNYTPMAERQIDISEVGKEKNKRFEFSTALSKALGSGDTRDSRLVVNPDPEESMDRPMVEAPAQPVSRPVTVEPVRIIAEHKVKSGESLGKIAARYYGRSTPTRVNAIFDVNRDRLTSIHAVRVGDKLRIPAIPDSDGIRFVEAKDFGGAAVANAQPARSDEIRIPVPIDDRPAATPAEETRREPEPIEFKWYEVRENDTLSRIAKSQMGSARLYLKLYDMNRDLLPNKNSIKPGMKIRIPLIRADEQLSSTGFSRPR